jgi:hypothetical protein
MIGELDGAYAGRCLGQAYSVGAWITRHGLSVLAQDAREIWELLMHMQSHCSTCQDLRPTASKYRSCLGTGLGD